MSDLTLVHLVVLSLFALLALMVITTTDAQNDQTVYALYVLDIVTLASNSDGAASSWVTDHAMTLARTESFALGVALVMPYWLALALSILFGACMTLVLGQEAVLKAWRSLKPSPRISR